MDKTVLRSRFAFVRLFIVCVVFALSHPFQSALAAGHGPVTYHYDELGRLAGVTDAAEASAIYTYDSVGNILAVTRLGAGQVAIVAFAPQRAQVGATVTISGNGFSTTMSQNEVKFNQTTATIVSSTATQIVTSVPAGATTGPITVTTPSGTASTSVPFTVHVPQAPTITDFTPAVGNAGTVVTISGTNYDIGGLSKVTFNNRTAFTTSASATSITSLVPTNASSGKIAVATPFGVAVSSADFYIPPAPYTAVDIAVMDRMNIGQSKSVVIPTAGKKAMELFEGTAGQQVSMSVSGVTITSGTISVIGPDATVLGSTSVSTSGGFIDVMTLPSSGTYTVFINPSATATGSVTMLLNLAQPVLASISAGGPAVTLTTTVPGQNGKLTFSGTAGQRISLKVAAISSSMNCPSFSIRKPDDSNLVAPTSTCSTTFYADTMTLPLSGNYSIVIDPAGTGTGSATFTLIDVPPDALATLAIDGPAVSIATTVPGQNAALTFSATAGQRISFKVTAISSSLNCPSFSISNPDGTSLLAPTTTCSATFYVDTKTLPLTGTYTILMNPATSGTGSATFALFEVVPDALATLAIDGPAVSIATTVLGQNAALTFSATAGQRISFKVTAISSSLNCPSFSISNPDGTSLLAPTTTCSATFYVDTKTLPLTGTYTILMNAASSETGSATFNLFEVPPDIVGDLVIGAAEVPVTLATPGQNANLSFAGTAEQQVTVRVTGNTLGCQTVSLRKPDGGVLVSSTTCNSSVNLPQQVLPLTGTYTVRSDPSGANVGSAAIAVTSP